jgi:hypothetical protein
MLRGRRCGRNAVEKCCECKREVPLLVNLRALQKPESFALSSELVVGMGFDWSRGAGVRREELEAKGGPLRLLTRKTGLATRSIRASL